MTDEPITKEEQEAMDIAQQAHRVLEEDCYGTADVSQLATALKFLESQGWKSKTVLEFYKDE